MIYILRKNEKGQAILESLIALILVCLVFFGLMQVFYLSMANMTTEYASFCAARSRSVGFREELVKRATKVSLIPASGRLKQLYAGSYNNNGYYNFVGSWTGVETTYQQFHEEASAIPIYLSYGNRPGYCMLNYEYWEKGEDFHSYYYDDYDYKQLDDHLDDMKGVVDKASVEIETSNLDGVITADVGFSEYPLIFPIARSFIGKRNLNIKSQAKVKENYSNYLD